MATKKAAGTAKNLRDSNPKYLGVKIADGQSVKAGGIIVRQRGTKFVAGSNTKLGKDHTVYSLVEGVVSFSDTRRTGFNGQTHKRKKVTVK
ncbi:MAG: 50S ribosomal protein L27 [Candidatus Paceibacterota bacterium]